MPRTMLNTKDQQIRDLSKRCSEYRALATKFAKRALKAEVELAQYDGPIPATLEK